MAEADLGGSDDGDDAAEPDQKPAATNDKDKKPTEDAILKKGVEVAGKKS